MMYGMKSGIRLKKVLRALPDQNEKVNISIPFVFVSEDQMLLATFLGIYHAA